MLFIEEQVKSIPIFKHASLFKTFITTVSTHTTGVVLDEATNMRVIQYSALQLHAVLVCAEPVNGTV